MPVIKLIAIAVFSVFPLAVIAQDISIKMAEIAPGSWFLMQDMGGPAMHVFRGKRGSHYVYDLVPGKDPNSARAFRDLRDVEGNVTKRTFSNGRVVTYTPHNCQRVVGQCSFVESGEKHDGTRYKTKMVRLNTIKGKGFTFTQVAIASDGTQVPIRSGTVHGVDAKGMFTRAEMKTHADGKIRKYRKLAASWGS